MAAPYRACIRSRSFGSKYQDSPLVPVQLPKLYRKPTIQSKLLC